MKYSRLGLFLLLLLLGSLSPLCAQNEAAAGDLEGDPLKLFERGQDAHARQDLAQALDYYNQALEVRPEFPEAELQKGAALIALKRPAEAETSLRRAAALRADWALPQALLGTLLGRAGRDREAEPLLRRALELEAHNRTALTALAEARTRAGAHREAVELLRRVTALPDAAASDWAARGAAERLAGEKTAALASLERALTLDEQLLAARFERGALYAELKKYPEAIRDLEEVRRRDAQQAAGAGLLLAQVMIEAGMAAEALRVFDSLDAATKNSAAGQQLSVALKGDEAVTPEVLAALEKSLASDPRNASLLARLGSLYRTRDPQRALNYYRGALEIEPRHAGYATGFAAALVQARRFPEAVEVLRRVLAIEPDNYTARANLATALYEMKSYAEAITEFKWVAAARPEGVVAHFFIATAYDHLRQFEEALAAYETFLAQADPQRNELEIEKVRLRLPSLHKQIKRGEGVKRK